MDFQSFCSVPAPLVETVRGPVRGCREGDVEVFKGIPYGRAGRFRAPQPVGPIISIFDFSISISFMVPVATRL